MKMTDSPGAMLVMPFRATAEAKELELSSIFQPVMFTALALTLVTSNQSAPNAVPLLQGATSVMTTLPGAVAVVMVRVKGALASGALPTVGSSTLTVTVYVAWV